MNTFPGVNVLSLGGSRSGPHSYARSEVITDYHILFTQSDSQWAATIKWQSILVLLFSSILSQNLSGWGSMLTKLYDPPDDTTLSWNMCDFTTDWKHESLGEIFLKVSGTNLYKPSTYKSIH